MATRSCKTAVGYYGKFEQLTAEEAYITAVKGDACDLPELLHGENYDFVYSNSLLEHVGGHVQRQKLAESVHSLANRHWIQTPYRYFPIEPHWVFPAFQWLPYEARVQFRCTGTLAT